MRMRFLLYLYLLFLIPNSCFGGSYSVDFVIKQVKLKKLPIYCTYMGVLHAGRTSKGKQLRKKYGPDWDHMHHFCWALIDLQKGYSNQAIGNLDYVLRNIKRNSKLRPMVLLKKASILITKQRYSDAVSVYGELVKIKPDSEKGWVGLVDLFSLMGDQNGARKVAKQGLRHVPGSKKLKAFLK